MDPAELRRRNLIADDAYPCTSPAGLVFERLSHHQALDKLLAMMDYKKLRAEQAALRQRGIYRGIGLASFIEVTNPSAAFYGVGGAKISAQDILHEVRLADSRCRCAEGRHYIKCRSCECGVLRLRRCGEFRSVHGIDDGRKRRRR